MGILIWRNILTLWVCFDISVGLTSYVIFFSLGRVNFDKVIPIHFVIIHEFPLLNRIPCRKFSYKPLLALSTKLNI